MHETTLGNTLWDGERDDSLICRAVREETHDVKTFILSAPEARLFRYAPGQFITLELEIDGVAIHRCYTLSSTPTRPDSVSITVKRVVGGTVSNWLHQHLQVGQRLRVLGPAGAFSCFLPNAPGPTTALPSPSKYLFLSAGSGITPMMSMARAAHDLALDADIAFVHSARTPADIIFARELELMAQNQPRFRLGFICEQRGGQASWAGFNGRLNLAALRNIAPDFLERSVYTCGPTPYMAALRALLQEAGYDMARYHEESFSFEAMATTTPQAQLSVAPQASAAPAQFNLTFQSSAASIACGVDQTILGAARAAGMRFPASCTQGLCGTCKTRMVTGKVDMKHAGGIRQREIDQGFILPCCSKPLSDVVLER